MHLKELILNIIFRFKYRKNIKNPSMITGSKGIKISKKTSIGAWSVLKAKRENIQGTIFIGKEVYIGENAYILAGSGSVLLKNNIYAGNNLVLLGGGDISIGNNVLMSHNIIISSSSHNFQDKQVMANNTSSIFKPINISDNVFIGANVSILMGTSIGEGAIIGAGSVVVENTIISEYEVWGGNPAKRLYTRLSLKEQIEEEMLNYLKTYPFHNLFLLYELKEVETSKFGGTCSDRTIHFKRILEKKFQSSNIEIKLHRTFINNLKTHTILKIKIENQVYFCDIGMGFPLTKLIPCSQNIKFCSYDIKFKSIIYKKQVTVYIDEGKGEKELMKIPLEEQSQKQIKEEISKRWQEKENLPFHNKLRYFFIHKDKFYQIKDDNYFSSRQK